MEDVPQVGVRAHGGLSGPVHNLEVDVEAQVLEDLSADGGGRVGGLPVGRVGQDDLVAVEAGVLEFLDGAFVVPRVVAALRACRGLPSGPAPDQRGAEPPECVVSGRKLQGLLILVGHHEGLTRLPVVEGRQRVVEVADQPGRWVVDELDTLVPPQPVEKLRGELLHVVDLTHLHRCHSGGLVVDLLPLHLVEVGDLSAGSAVRGMRARHVVHEPLGSPPGSRGPRLEHERAMPDRLAGARFLNRGLLPGLVDDHGREALLVRDAVHGERRRRIQVHREGRVVSGLDEVRELLGTELAPDQPQRDGSVALPVQGADHVGARKRHAVVEGQAVPYRHGPRQEVVARLPLIDRLRTLAVVDPDADQPLQYGVGHLPRAGCRRPQWVEGLQAAGADDLEDAAELLAGEHGHLLVVHRLIVHLLRFGRRRLEA